MGLNRIALLVTSIAAVGCASATPLPSEPQARTPEAPAEPPPPPVTAAVPAPPPTVDIPPAADVASAPPEAPPAASTESAPADPQSDGSAPPRLDHLEDRERPEPLDAVKGTAIVSNVSVSGAAVSNAARVVAGMRAGFRQCYNRSLQHNPKSQGQIRLTIQVQPDGAVQSVTSAPTGILSAGSVACVTARARAAQFAGTDGGSATVSAIVTFVNP